MSIRIRIPFTVKSLEIGITRTPVASIPGGRGHLCRWCGAWHGGEEPPAKCDCGHTLFMRASRFAQVRIMISPYGPAEPMNSAAVVQAMRDAAHGGA